MTALPEVLQWCAASDKVKSNTLAFPTIRYGVTDFAGFIQICYGVPRIAIPPSAILLPTLISFPYPIHGIDTPFFSSNVSDNLFI